MRIKPGWILAALGALALVGLAGVYLLFRRTLQTAPRSVKVAAWFRDDPARASWVLPSGQRCPGAPFQMPVEGFIGFLWDDSFQPLHRHSGLDIFGLHPPGEEPVYAAYDGYLTRLPDWKSSLIVRIPSDPLQPARQIWTYYTHMAGPQGDSFIDAAFPPGSSEVFVKAGTLLGQMGNFSGTPGAPVGVHLHFSVVLDDGKGKFRDERDIGNTLDPSPYFGMQLNANLHPPFPAECP
jgi:peptidoglycan LD-endopeptidase LytH